MLVQRLPPHLHVASGDQSMQPTSPRASATLIGFMAGFMVTGLLLIAGSRLIMAIWN